MNPIQSFLAAATAVSAFGVAQSSPSLPAAAQEASLVRGCQLQTIDGELYGTGSNYQAHFTSEGLEFLPALGDAAPYDLPLDYTLQSIGRASGGESILVSRGVRSHRGTRVEYRRERVVERYDVLGEGVEQSFVFSTIPQGEGDLVVRGRVRTELEPSPTPRGFAFLKDGVGVKIESVVGIDANGARVAGAMRLDGDILELSLPASFVDRAALPLVLDPLIGTSIDLDSTANNLDDQDPDIAYDTTHDRFLAVFLRRFSATSASVMGQLINGDGSMQGVNTVLRISGVGVSTPAVANVRFTERFLCVWRATGGIEAVSVRANPSAVTGPMRVIGADPGGGFRLQPDVGGESTLNDDEAIVVWTNTATGTIEARQVRPATDDTIVLNGGIVTVAPASGGEINDQPAISKSGGSTGYHMIVWHERLLARDRVVSAIVTRNLGFVDANTPLTSNQDEHFNPDCDGDGRAWVAAYEREEPGQPGVTDIACRGVALNDALFGTDSAILFPENIIVSQANNDDVDPTVSWFGQSALVCYSNEGVNPSEYDVRYWNVDPFTGESCGGAGSVEFGFATDSRMVQFASRRSGEAGSTDDLGVVIWDSEDVGTGNSDILVRPYSASRDGNVEDLGGGCGEGGTARATCASVNNLDFTHRVFVGEPNRPVWFILSPTRLDAGCGSCTLVPSVFDAFVFSTTSDILGRADVVTPIPAVAGLAGLRWFEQWAMSPTGGPACGAVGVDFSNALQVTIED